MPTYGYVCEECGQELEAFQKMSDAPLRTCPACQKDTLRRRIFASGIVFKGSGFYKTDYAGKGRGSASNGGGEKAESGKADAGNAGSDKSGSEKADSAPKSEAGASDKAASSTE